MKRTLKRSVKAPTHRGTDHYCGECARPCWDENNRDYKGDLFIGRCRWSDYCKRLDGTGVVYVDHNACEHFEGKGGEQ